MKVCICRTCREDSRKGDVLPFAESETHSQGRDEFERCSACGQWASYGARAIDAVLVDGVYKVS